MTVTGSITRMVSVMGPARVAGGGLGKTCARSSVGVPTTSMSIDSDSDPFVILVVTPVLAAVAAAVGDFFTVSDEGSFLSLSKLGIEVMEEYPASEMDGKLPLL